MTKILLILKPQHLLFSFILLTAISQSKLHAQLVDWAQETKLGIGDTFVSGQIITNFGGTGLDARIDINTGSVQPTIHTLGPTFVRIRNATNSFFTLTFLNGTADIHLVNERNLQQGERITISNPDGQNITIQQTTNNGGSLMTVDGVVVPALNANVVQDNTAVVREINNSAGTSWNATMQNITSFTWRYQAVAGTSGTEGFALTLTSTVLPIELASFTLKERADNLVEIEWQTLTEINNDFFTLERSSNALDWNMIASINGAGNSLNALEYAYTDNQPLNGQSYYRLKQTDFDGQYTYSKINSINIDNRASNQLNVYPNPSQNLLNVEGKQLRSRSIHIYNSTGQEVSSLTKSFLLDNKIEIDISKLKHGVYFLKSNTTSNTFLKR